MHVLDGDLVVSPTDLTRFLACRHLTRLDLEVARGRRQPPEQADEALDLLFRRGLEHEHAHLAELTEQVAGTGGTVVRIDPNRYPPGRDGLQRAEADTVMAMAGGAGVVYQATFFDGAWRGHADFLVRRDDRPGRWPWSYDLADTKLARRAGVAALLQLAGYADRLTVLQGIAPEQLIVVTGDGRRRPYPYARVASYAGGVRRRLLAFVADPPATRPERVPRCVECRWRDHCRQQWLAEDDLTLVAQLRRPHAAALRAAGIGTLTALAGAQPSDLPPRIPPAAGRRMIRQAQLQLVERRTGRPTHDLLPAAAGRGLSLLPAPSPGDVFFDMEGDPHVRDVGLEYLFGLVQRDAYTGYWALEPADERAAFEALVDHLIAAWAADPGMHVYHYAPYEPGRLKLLAGRYDTRIDEVDRLLRGDRLIDLYTVVKQGLQIGKDSYSLKKLEDHYWGHGRAGSVGDALGSVIAFERWLTERDDALLEGIRAYNEEDCRSTEALRDWLEGLRAEAGGDAVHPRPQHGDGAPSAPVQERADRTEQLWARLAESVRNAGTDQAAATTAPTAATELLAGLLGWHRREALPEWADYFRRLAATEEELLTDPVAVSGLCDPVQVGQVRRSVRWRMLFPPQDTALLAGDRGWRDPGTGRAVGRVAEVHPGEGWLVLEQADGRQPPGCRALVPPGPVDTRQLQARLAELAESVAWHGVDGPGTGWRAGRDLLLRRPLGAGAVPLRRDGEPLLDAVLRVTGVARRGPLPAGTLAVQGPPGTGKTRIGAELVVAALAAGHRVGLCAFSHAAVTGLLTEVVRRARGHHLPVTAVQKADGDQACLEPEVTRVGRAADVAAALTGGRARLVAGSAWLYADPELQRSLDVLVIDEAGQMSLANVLAISGSARQLVLFGDPQQLSQPALGAHPPGAGRSALEHVLDGRATVSADRGLLLDTSYRMHPELAGFVSELSYDGRVRVAPGLDRLRIESASALHGSGLRWVPVPHRDRSTSSPAEAEVVARLVRDVLADGVRVDEHGRARIQPSDVLVLSPYNQQVYRLRRALCEVPGGARVRVGTVDSLQGRQASLVIYSLAGSDARSAGRGIDFLLNPQRLTVALSRARALVVVVASPALTESEVTTPEQLMRVDALCRFVDRAVGVPAPVGLVTGG